VKEKLLLFKPFLGHTTSNDILKTDYLMEIHSTEWKKCAGVSSNEACMMTRKHSQIVTQI